MSDGEFVAAHDVILIGGGGAGLRAAIAIAETNPRLDVAVRPTSPGSAAGDLWRPGPRSRGGLRHPGV